MVFRVLFFGVCFLFCSLTAGAHDLHIMCLDLPPYAFKEDGKTVGMAYDAGELLAREAGLNAVSRLVCVARGMEEISMGRSDMIIMFPNDTINRVAMNLGTILTMDIVVMSLAGSNINSLADLRKKTVASIRGAIYDPHSVEEIGLIVEPTSSYRQSLKLLLEDRVDAVIGPSIGLNYALRAEGFSVEKFAKPLPLTTVDACVFLSRKAPPELAGKVRRAMERLIRNGTVKRIADKYGQ